MTSSSWLQSFRYRQLNQSHLVAVSDSGDHMFLTHAELEDVQHAPAKLAMSRQAELKAKYFLRDPHSSGIIRLLESRQKTKHETVLAGPSLHIIVPTLRCAHSCRYCQVSRALESDGFTISRADLDHACDAIFESPSPTLTVEFQGGDPLLRFDLVRHAIERIAKHNYVEKRNVRFVVASTLHQLDGEMCTFFKEHEAYLSTSIDGPEDLHNRNRPTPTRDSYSRTRAGITLAREQVSPDSVSALMTTTRDSLNYPEQIVDSYVELGLHEIFIRPLSPYGFARRNRQVLGYSPTEFQQFYEKAFERVLYWNHRGVPIREVRAAIALNKMLSPFDAGYVDLQNPTGAGLAVLLYNYDGFVYPGDEARMLAGSGDQSLRLGRIGESLMDLLGSDVERELIASSMNNPTCQVCAYRSYCGPDPVAAYNQLGSCAAPAQLTEHCQHQLALFDFLFRRLLNADPWFEDLAHRWAQPLPGRKLVANA
jgi:His-Xaa-Ser system radical SAM maturase HxsB